MSGPERIWFTKYGDYNLEFSDRADDVEYVRADLATLAAPPNGGPAYPVMWEYAEGETGMTLRDWFAGQALAGLLSDPNERASHATFADESYRMADAMIAARGGK